MTTFLYDACLLQAVANEAQPSASVCMCHKKPTNAIVGDEMKVHNASADVGNYEITVS